MDRKSAVLLVLGVTAVVLYVVSGKLANKQDSSSLTSHNGGSETRDLGPAVSEDPLIIQTKYGLVRGTYSDGVRVFHGVPYAKPPVDDMRWKLPVEPDPWDPEVIDATKVRPGCPQECSLQLYCSNTTSEDCLFLEIYVPETVSSPAGVMVYLHGGSFKDVTTTIPLFEATALVKRSGLVVVLVEHRLGALGFLVTGNGEGQAKGNYGLHDHRLALRFVHENIGAFGGDPQKVTLVGQSAGAQSVLIHLVSEESSQYFRYAIVESMPFTFPYRKPEAARNLGKSLAEILNCVNNNKIDVACLRSKTPTEIINAQKITAKESINPLDKIQHFSPVVDGDIVKFQPLEALKDYAENNKQTKPLIFGYTKDEGVLFINSLFPEPLPFLILKLLIGAFLGQLPEEVYQLYTITNETDTRRQLSDILTDFMFRCPLVYTLGILGAGPSQEAWLYTWDRPIGMELPKDFDICNQTSCHGEEIPFVFQTFNKISKLTNNKDIELSNKVIDYYTNFIIYGNPNGDKNNTEKTVPSQQLTDWKSATSDIESKDLSRLVFTRNGSLELIKDVDDKFCDFWTKVGYSVLSKRNNNIELK